MQCKWFLYKLYRPFVWVAMQHSMDIDDLMQLGYFAILKAVSTYDAACGYKFITQLRFSVLKTLSYTFGRCIFDKAAQGKNKAVISLNSPVYENENNSTELQDNLVDTKAEFEDALDEADLAAVAVAEVERLPDRQRVAVQMHIMQNVSYQRTGKTLGVSGERVRGIVDAALKRLRASKALCIAERREQIEILAYRHVGLAAWKSGTGSATEWAVERMEYYDKHQRGSKAAQFMKAEQALEMAKAACVALRAQQDDAMRAGNYARFDVLRKKFEEMQMLCFEIESEQARREAPKRRNK